MWQRLHRREDGTGPADASAGAGHRKATYDQRAPLPPEPGPYVPDAYNTVVTMEAYAEVAGSRKGPFPVSRPRRSI